VIIIKGLHISSLFLKIFIMGINVNTVYTTVLSILNKEQRGYLTTDEFNKLATQVQLDIFENYFEDYNQFLRGPKTDVEFASRMDHVYEEIQNFTTSAIASAKATTGGITTYTQPVKNASNNISAVHRMGIINYQVANGSPEVALMNKREYTQQMLSPLTQPSLDFPIGVYENNKITVYPASPYTPAEADVMFNYIRKPNDIRWGYTVGSLGQYIYDSRDYDSTAIALSSLTSSSNFGSATASAGTYNLSQGSGNTNFQYAGNGGNTGTGATIQVVVVGNNPVNLSATTTSITVTASGSGYGVGDVLTIPATAIAGLSAPIQITLTASNLMGATGQGSSQFEIDETAQTSVVLGVLKYTGIILNDTTVMQAANGLQAMDDQNAKK